jgi:Cellulose binding domain
MGMTTPLGRRAFPLVLVLLAAALGVPLASTASAATLSARVAVNASQGRGTIPATAFGINTAVYDSLMNDAPVAGLMRSAGINVMRYPGGSYGDIYHWQTHTAPGGFVAPGTTFDSFMTTVRNAGAQAMVIANYGTGTPQEAADWVRSANITRGYDVRYWEIGNEVYGNGFYGAQWEADNHPDKSPAAYASNALQYITAMKAVDPTVKVGVVVTTPGFWPDGVVGPGSSADWNHTVLPVLAPRADFVVFHWYPGASSSSVASMLTTPSLVAGAVSQLRSLINQFGGANAPNVRIMVTETNSTLAKTSQPAALFAADNTMTMLENGIASVDWWNTHNGMGTPSTNPDGSLDYNDEGVLSNASCNGGTCEPPAETPFAPYFGLQMLNRVGVPGDQMVAASSDQSPVAAHAVRRANGHLTVLLVNKDPGNSYAVTLLYSGFQPSGTPTVFSFLNGARSITSAQQGTATAQTIPPYSLTTVDLAPGGASATTSTTAPASSTTSTTTGATTTTTAPAGGCQVSYTITSQWQDGFTADVTIRNPGPTAISGWSLAWSFSGDQRITNAWNAVATQTGQAVSAADGGWNRVIAAGGSAGFGFQASFSGSNARPTSFRLNGTACTVT